VNEPNWQTGTAPDPTVPTARPAIRGTRVAVDFVRELLAEGWTPQEIARHFGHLTADGVKPEGITTDDESAGDQTPEFPRAVGDDGSGMPGFIPIATGRRKYGVVQHAAPKRFAT
jgi:uncharacterized protein (DUF433 family)